MTFPVARSCSQFVQGRSHLSCCCYLRNDAQEPVHVLWGPFMSFVVYFSDHSTRNHNISRLQGTPASALFWRFVPSP